MINELITPKYFFPDYSGRFGDKRLATRGELLWKRLSTTPCSVVSKIAENRAEQKGFYRFLNNESVKETELVEETSKRVGQLSLGRHLLCVQDTCEINLNNHKGRLKEGEGLGQSDNSETGNCFKLHPGLVLDALTMNPLGFSHIKLFHREEDMLDRFQRNYKKQPIEEKESYKWIEVAQKSKEILKEAVSVTFIEDREGDIYEQFATIPDDRTHLLIRSKTTRNTNQEEDLYKQLAKEPIVGTYTIEIPTDKRKNQYKRQATIGLRYKECKIKCPANLKGKNYPEYIPITCISVKEIGDVPTPIDWKLLTTHKIENYKEALQIVDWYNARWYIEQLFRILKKQGFGIEETELESGWAIRKLVVMQMTALLKILQMNIAYSAPEEGQEIEEVFTAEEIEGLTLMNKKLQGKTYKLQNHNDPKRTKWATWVVGRIGGWKGYDSQGPPGVITLKRGLDRLYHIIEGTRLVKDVGTR